MWLKTWYSTSGHQTSDAGISDDVSLSDVLRREAQHPNSTIDAARLVDTIRLLSPARDGLTFLDVGCGYGFFSRAAKERGFAVTSLELAKTERAVARAMLEAEPVASSFEDFTPSPVSMQFDALLMSQILEHAFDVNLWMSKARGLLRNGGVIAIALPNFDGFLRHLLGASEPYITPPAHLNFFAPGSLRRLLEKHGFKVEIVQHVSRVPLATFEKRLPRGLGLPRLAWRSSRVALGFMDAARLGMMINVYARKI